MKLLFNLKKKEEKKVEQFCGLEFPDSTQINQIIYYKHNEHEHTNKKHFENSQ